jgi:hypothetical protein
MTVKVMLKNDLPILEQDERLGVVTVQVSVKAVNLRLAPTQALRRHRIPCTAGQWRKIEALPVSGDPHQHHQQKKEKSALHEILF